MMKYLTLIVFFISTYGCALTLMNDDLMNNRYLDVDPLPSPEATYVGVWTAGAAGGLISIKINPDGTGKFCSTSLIGNISKGNAKVYKTFDELFLIQESGIRFKINDYSEKEINAKAYGKDYRFIPGVHSATCKDFIE